MSTENRIKSLREKHAAADAQLQLALLSPRPDAELVRGLKKKKLNLKDEITRLENPDRRTAPKKSRQKKGSRPATNALKNPEHAANQVSISADPIADIDLAA